MNKIDLSQPKAERQKHLDLSEPCYERGGNSGMFRGVLAQYLNTNFPERRARILLCHACNNDKCSNPRHLYWGSDKENQDDSVENGTRVNIYKATVAKYGEDYYRERSRKVCKEVGLQNKNVPKSEEHREKLAESMRKYHAERRKQKECE